MNLRRMTLLAVATVALAGCATKPQAPVDLRPAALSGGEQRVGVALSKPPKPSLALPGADCLLCIIAAQAANISLGKHVDTLTMDEWAPLKSQLAAALRKKGAKVQVIPEEIDVTALPDASGSGENLAGKNFSSFKQKYNVDKLVVVQVDQVGFMRTYASYFPTSDPKGVIRGSGYMVNLATNAYDWYKPFHVVKSSEGAWDEPMKFPGLTNAYYQALEQGKDELLKPLSQ